MSDIPSKFKKNTALFPVGLIYGIVTGIRNTMFNIGLKKEHSFNIPVINVGNIAVGGTGKTPHTEYLVEMLHDKYKVAVLSRGYKRKTKGYILASRGCYADTIGDEPYQIHEKYPDIAVAVCENRVKGINRLIKDSNPEIILLDDAFQHRYVKPSVNIMLTDFNRFITYDMIMPAGRLRESKKGMKRADIVIVTKCPDNVDMESTKNMLRKYTNANIYFSTYTYKNLESFLENKKMPLECISENDSVILFTGIANPSNLIKKISERTKNIEAIQFADHHSFNIEDIFAIQGRYDAVQRHTNGNVYVITTQKDSARLKTIQILPQFIENLWVIPVQVSFIGNCDTDFRNDIQNRLLF